MRTQLLSATGKRVLGTVIACFVWAAMPAGAKAQAVAWTDKTCEVSTSTIMGMTFYKIKGKVTLSNLPANKNIYVTFNFKKEGERRRGLG